MVRAFVATKLLNPRFCKLLATKKPETIKIKAYGNYKT